jgi:hypothetical protein
MEDRTEFEPSKSYVSPDDENEDQRFRRLVLKDVKKGLTDEEREELEADRQLWFDETTLLAQEVQSQLTTRKAAFADTMPAAQYHRLKAEYEKWRASAIRFQIRLLDRRRDLKAELKDHNRSANPQYGEIQTGLLREILAELKALRAERAR